MATNSVLRFRRSAAQLHALAEVERTIRAADTKCRRKYLRDFNEAFHNYRSVLNSASFNNFLRRADIVLVGDYHALPASQRFTAGLLERVRQVSGRPVVLALEAVVARDQHIVDEWFRGEAEIDELRERIRFDLDWGYAWQPYRDLLQAAREHADAIYGLDCLPRSDMRSIAARDRHAAVRIAEVRAQHPDAVLVVLFGESHLAPNHLPKLVRAGRPADRILTVLQNIDALYWRAAGEDAAVDAVQVDDDVACVFTSTPLEKYENYRLCIERWRQERAAPPDLAPTFYNLIDALLRFLHIDRYAAAGERSIVDLLPEVSCHASGEQLKRILVRRRLDPAQSWDVLSRVAERGSCYVRHLNTIYAREFRVPEAAEEITHFVHAVCRGALRAAAPAQPQLAEDLFYTRVMEEALAFVGSKALCPSRPPAMEADLYGYYAQSREAIERLAICGYRDFLELIDFLVLHKDFERNPQRYYSVPELLTVGTRFAGERFEFAVEKLGQMLGSELYEAYLVGRIRRRYLRWLFFRPIEAAGSARALYFNTLRRVVRRCRRAPQAAISPAVSDRPGWVLP